MNSRDDSLHNLLYTAEEMSRADSNAQKLGIPGGVLMERAGAAMALEILSRFNPENALVVCGGGNNGGDGFVIARELSEADISVSVIATKEEYSGDAKVNLDVLKNLDIEVHPPEDLDELLNSLKGADIVVDALLGTGFSGEVREREAGMMRSINAASVPVASVDVPSGVNGSTGEVEGDATRADITLCAHAAKVGCVVSPGRDHAGEVVVVGIGLPEKARVETSISLTRAGEIRGLVPRLGGEVHKYSAGTLLVVAGASSMTGAAVMVAGGAQRAGCGIVLLCVPENAAPAVDTHLTEAIVYGAPQDDSGYISPEAVGKVVEQAERAAAVVIGPGIGVGDGQRELIAELLHRVKAPLVLDADGITNIAGTDALKRREHLTVITPHAGELGRLLGVGAKEISARRIHFARLAATENGCCVLLKGSDTLVVEGEKVAVNTTGSVALATAGTGDVLSGVIGAFMSRGMSPFDAARVGAWVHGRAVELWLEDTGWPEESLVAMDLLPHLPQAVNGVL